jgi:hypothetical protein
MTVTWAAVPNSRGRASAMWLLQDGNVLVHLENNKALYTLAPNAKGSYSAGSWNPVGAVHLERLFFASAVLSDGRVVMCGGEYSGPGLPQTESNACEIYDPVRQVSTVFAAPPGWTNIGDAPSVVLPDGRFMIGNTQGGGQQVALLNPATLKWSIEGGDSDNEQGYVLLQTGDVLTTGVYTPTSMRYNAAAKSFVPDAALPAMLGKANEIGPGITLMDGRVIWFGTTGHTCIYQPGTTGSSGTWVQGPDLPVLPRGVRSYASDAPALLEPNGKVLLVAAIPPAQAGTLFVEYDPLTNSFEVLAGAPDPGPAQNCRMLLLPDGRGLISTYSGNWYVATFDVGAHTSWAPTIDSFPTDLTEGQTVTLTGRQLCGLSECQSFGDDNQQAEHYPLVRFTAVKNATVTYARTHDVTTRSIAPNQSGSVQVDIPAGLDHCAVLRDELENLDPGDFPSDSAYQVARRALQTQLSACVRAAAKGTHSVKVIAMGIPSIDSVTVKITRNG